MTVGRPQAVARRGLHLLVLSSFAVAQPLFDLLGDTPEFFVVRGSTNWDIFAFAVGLVVLPPAVLLLVEALGALVHPRLQDALHLFFVAALAALIAMQALKRASDLPANAIFALAALLGVAFAAAYQWRGGVRSFLTVLAPASLVFLALFLIHSPLDKLSLESEAHAKTAATVSSRTPVVMVVFDELPITSLMDERRRIDSVRYPSFADLARNSTWFRNATTVHEHTTEAVPAILTGRDPKPGALPLLDDHPDNLFTLLGGSYRMHVFEPVTQLCPIDLCPRERQPFAGRMRSLASDVGIVYLHVFLPDETRRRLPSVTDTWMNFGKEHADEQLGAKPLAVRNAEDVDKAVGRQLWQDLRFQFERYADSIAPSERPTLYFVHSMLPHSPWRYLPSGRQYGDALGIDGLADDRWGKDDWLVTQGYQRHLLQTGFVDRLLGRLLRRLHEAELYDRSLVVVVADHGVSFRPGDRRRGVTPSNIHDVASVPLFVKKPGQREARVVDRSVRTTDIVPTIAEVLGTQLPYEADGRSLFDAETDWRTVEVDQRAGRTVVAGADSVAERKDETLAHMLSVFGSGRTGSLFEIGPHRELVGRTVAALPVMKARGARASVDGETLLRSVDLDSALTPSHVTGRLEGDAAPGTDLALAVNGRIAAVTRSFGPAAEVKFSAFVAESAFREGANEVEVYAVTERGRRLALARLGGTGKTPSYALVATPSGEAVKSSTGRQFPVVRGAVGGVVEDWFFEADTVRIGGWAGDVQEREPAETVLVFSGRQLLYSGTPSVGRADLAEKYPGLGRSGFAVELPREIVQGGSGVDLRFFAVRGDVASELEYADGFPWKPGA